VTLMLDRVTWHTVVCHSLTWIYTPNFIQIGQPTKNFLWLEVGTYGHKSGLQTSFIRLSPRADLTNTANTSLKRSLRWLGHVLRMEESRIARQAMYSGNWGATRESRDGQGRTGWTSTDEIWRTWTLLGMKPKNRRQTEQNGVNPRL